LYKWIYESDINPKQLVDTSKITKLQFKHKIVK